MSPLTYIPILLSVATLILGILGYLTQKDKFETLKTNHFAHLEADVKQSKEDIDRLREDITKLFDKCEQTSKDIAFIKGKMNGSLK